MLGASKLKREIKITQTSVECPVKDCKTVVSRQRKTFKCSKEFFCPEHGIYISPSTFEYSAFTDNLIWKDEGDLDLLKRINLVKRESRIARDNSEDAVTWNIFRFLEREKLLSKFLSKISNDSETNPEIIYWSYSQPESTAWSKLIQARQQFERKPDKGSEPDIIIKTDQTLFVIEAKLGASNNTVPSSKDLIVKEKYVNGGSCWYQTAFKSEFETIAITNRKYELLRFWLLGSWIANNLGLKFVLINLVPSNKEKDIEPQFRKHIQENANRIFQRYTWEDSYRCIQEKSIESTQKELILEYFKNKTKGFNYEGQILNAFSI